MADDLAGRQARQAGARRQVHPVGQAVEEAGGIHVPGPGDVDHLVDRTGLDVDALVVLDDRRSLRSPRERGEDPEG